MSWWGWPTRIAPREPQNPPLTAPQPNDGTRSHTRRLRGPVGVVIWTCATPTGPLNCQHANEDEAQACGQREGRVWWPRLIDDNGGTT